MPLRPKPLILLLVLVAGCRQAKPTLPVAEVFLPDDGSVAFSATPLSTSSDGTQRWEGTYAENGETARFDLELGPSQSIDAKQQLGFGHGKFIAVDGSQSGPLLLALQKALQARHFPKNSTRLKELRFDYADLGNAFSISPAGGFSENPPGHWRATKLFLGQVGTDDDIEVFFNLNPVLKKGEFSIKDPDNADDVLIQLSKVL